MQRAELRELASGLPEKLQPPYCFLFYRVKIQLVQIHASAIKTEKFSHEQPLY